jgi:uncharacterized lipoprotein YajG
MKTYLRLMSVPGAALMLAACSSTAGNVKPNATSTASAQKAPCVEQTASRITSKDWNCSPSGRTYTSVDLSRTGVSPAQDGLQLLDPSLRIQH